MQWTRSLTAAESPLTQGSEAAAAGSGSEILVDWRWPRQHSRHQHRWTWASEVEVGCAEAEDKKGWRKIDVPIAMRKEMT